MCCVIKRTSYETSRSLLPALIQSEYTIEMYTCISLGNRFMQSDKRRESERKMLI